MGLEDAICAESPEKAPLADVVEEDRVSGVTAPAFLLSPDRASIWFLLSLHHRVCIWVSGRSRVTFETLLRNGNPKNGEMGIEIRWLLYMKKQKRSDFDPKFPALHQI